MADTVMEQQQQQQQQQQQPSPFILTPVSAIKVEAHELSAPTSPSILHTPTSMAEPATPKEKADHLVKKKRGRPKSAHSETSNDPLHRNATGRSKTGCITCRRRKKKCDEAKPTCRNCEKNNIACEGYSEKTYWRSSSTCHCSKAQKINLDFTPSTLPSMYEGLETALDAHILDHFANRMSWVLTIHDGRTNHFRDTVLPLAYTHPGLMHGILALSASHMYQAKKEFHVFERQDHHLATAVNILGKEVACTTVSNPTMALIIALILLHITDGSNDGQYRWHLEKFRVFLWNGPRTGQWRGPEENPVFAAFVYEFYRYHEIHAMCPKLDETHPAVEHENVAAPMPAYVSVVPPTQSACFGVLDGYDRLIVRGMELRAQVREHFRRNHGRGVDGGNAGAAPAPMVLDFATRQRGAELERALREWDSGQVRETPRWYLAEMYRLASWIVLYRTMNAVTATTKTTSPTTIAKLSALLDEAFAFARHMPPQDPCVRFMLAPVFRFGCSAFEVRHREKVEEALGVIAAYTGMGNVARAKEVLVRLWALMDKADPMGWDPESLLREMKYDFLIT